MDWILPPLAFSYAFNQVQPGIIVDKIIKVVVDVLVPGKGTGQSNWWMRGLRHIEQHAERTQRELDIRSNLREWDNEFPYAHHELIIRYAAGILASNLAVIAVSWIRGRGHHPSRRNY